MPEKRKRTLKIIVGHGAFVGIHRYIHRPVRYMVFLRNPIERIRSHYGYFLFNTVSGFAVRPGVLDTRGNPVSFETWLRNTVDVHDYMTRFLYERLTSKKVHGDVTDRIFQDVVNGLEQFHMVGFVERPSDHYFLYDQLNLPLLATRENITPNTYKPDWVDERLIAPYIRYDSKLYEYFRDHPNRPYDVRKNVSLLGAAALEYIWNMVQ